jgi:hypothetical protein
MAICGGSNRISPGIRGPRQLKEVIGHNARTRPSRIRRLKVVDALSPIEVISNETCTILVFHNPTFFIDMSNPAIAPDVQSRFADVKGVWLYYLFASQGDLVVLFAWVRRN